MRRAGCKGNYGSHTTQDLGLLAVQARRYSAPAHGSLRHATQQQTLVYLCIQAEEIKNIYQMEL